MDNARMPPFPKIIQGGMGVKISGWSLARAVSMSEQQGTVSGIALERITAIILQLGDPGGHIRRALSHFQFPDIAKKVLDAFSPKNTNGPYKISRTAPIFTIRPSELLIALTICANFAFVWLAKEGHNNPISINYLEKLAMPHVYAITGAMMAKVDYITMGAGIPLQIPEVINNISEGKTASYPVPIAGKSLTSYTMEFNPKKFFGDDFPLLPRSGFIPIISSNPLANLLMAKTPTGSIHGFVVERPSAGGHNAPPRKKLFNENGELIYGKKDEVDYGQIADLGLPFWIGGSCASPDKLKWAQLLGAAGIQVGSIFALCDESDMGTNLKNQLKQAGFNGNLSVITDAKISPTGYPFKVARLAGTISETEIYNNRQRICDQGGLVSLYEKKDGTIGYRCGAEPVLNYLRKEGVADDTISRACLCNGLFATTGIQAKKTFEAPIITLGEDLSFLRQLMKDANSTYSAKDAINYLLSDVLT
jgi:nitronate monooxygenase